MHVCVHVVCASHGVCGMMVGLLQCKCCTCLVAVSPVWQAVTAWIVLLLFNSISWHIWWIIEACEAADAAALS